MLRLFLSDEPFAADLPPGSTLKRATPPSPVENKVSTQQLSRAVLTASAPRRSAQDDMQFMNCRKSVFTVNHNRLIDHVGRGLGF